MAMMDMNREFAAGLQTAARSLMDRSELTEDQFRELRLMIGAGGRPPKPDRGANYSSDLIRSWLATEATRTRVALPLMQR